MNGLTALTSDDDRSAEFDLDASIAALGTVAQESSPDPCTGDTCGSARQGACTTCSQLSRPMGAAQQDCPATRTDPGSDRQRRSGARNARFHP